MPFAIELYLDHSSAQIVRDLWTALSRKGISSSLLNSGAKPHLTLGVYEYLDFAGVAADLAIFAKRMAPLDLTLSSFGAFTSADGILFLAPAPTAPLLELHARFHEDLRHLEGVAWAHYLPGHWVPHCRLANELTPARLPSALEACLQAPLPILCRVDQVGIASFPPVKHLFVTPLTGR